MEDIVMNLNYVCKPSGLYIMSKADFEKGIYLKVIDYYDFDENMLMYLSGYRLAGVVVGEERCER